MLQKLKEQLNRKKYNLIICAVLFALCIVQTMVMCRVRADELQTGRNLFILLHAAAWVLMAFFVMWGQLRSGYSRWRYIAGAVLMAAGVAGSIFLELTADYQLTASVGRGAVFSVIVAAVEVCLFPGKLIEQILRFERHRDYILASLVFVVMELVIDKVLAIVDISELYKIIKNAGQIALALLWLKYCRFLRKTQLRGKELLILLLVAVVNCFMFNVCVGGYAILKLWWHVPVFLCCVCLYFLPAGRFRGLLYGGEVIMTVFAVLNGYVIKFRGTPVMPDDFYAAATAANVAGNYSYVPGFDILVTAALGVIAVMFIRCLDVKKEGIRKSCAYCGGAVAALCVSMMGFWYSGVSTSVFNPLLTARYEGYLRAFASSARAGSIEEPEGYSVKEIQKIADASESVSASEAVSGEQPDIIVIMNEAFSDLGVVGDFETSEDYMPYIHGLEGNNVSKGWMVARRGSGTVYTESEFLFSTSASNYFGTIPYVRSIRSDIPSLVSVLDGQGYYTVGFHPEKGSNYCRSTVWSCMGFDKIMFKDGMTSDIKVCNEYCSDESDFRQLIDLYEDNKSKEPLFLFNVTMQNHSPYAEADSNSRINITSFEAEEDAENYLTYIRETDRAYEQLTEYFSKVEHPTIILMFGDHQPGISDRFYESVYGKNVSQLTNEESLRSIMVPYIMWTNYDVKINDIGTISPNYLAPWLLETAGLEMSGFEQQVWSMLDEYPVIATNVYMDKSGELHSYGEENSLPDWLKQYRLLTYNYIFDSKNRVDSLFEYKKASDR